MIIIGGIEESTDKPSTMVEEIDFLKRNLVNLPHIKTPRANSNAFMVNDSIYVFGGCSNAALNGVAGEKYSLSENKWREVKPKNMGENEQKSLSYLNMGPVSLLYE